MGRLPLASRILQQAICLWQPVDDRFPLTRNRLMPPGLSRAGRLSRGAICTHVCAIPLKVKAGFAAVGDEYLDADAGLKRQARSSGRPSTGSRTRGGLAGRCPEIDAATALLYFCNVFPLGLARIPINTMENNKEGVALLACVGVTSGYKSAHPGGVNMFLGDGSVRFVSEEIDYFLWNEYGTTAGGERAQLADNESRLGSTC